MVLHRCAAVFLLAGLCPAQLLVAPGSHAAVEGTGSTNVPFGRSTATRVQTAYDGMLFPGPRTITGLAFRLDGWATTQGKQVDCEIRLSTMPLPLTGMSPLFAQNRGADETIVLPRQVLALPGQAAGLSPNAFLPAIPFPTAFAYDPRNGPLLVEIVVFAQTPVAYPLDATWVCTSPELPIGPPGCQGSSSLPLRVESATTQVIWGRPWVARVLDAPAGSLVTFALGSRETGTWNGWTLPQDLGPLGAPNCFVSIDILGSFFGVAMPDGTASFPFTIPNQPSAVGVWLRFQAGALDPGANALGVTTSQARKVQVCGWEPVGRIWASGTAAVTGQWEIGVAPVVQFTVQ